MKNILAVDTASSLLSVCIKKDESFFESTIDYGLKHSETLMTEVDRMLKTAEMKAADLDLLVCSEGPGSFTGLRIGMATIKGLAAGLDIPYTAVPTSEYLARGLEYFPGAVVPVLDARKQRFYSAVFLEGKKLTADLDISAEDLFKILKSYDQVLFTGPDCAMMDLSIRDGLVMDDNYFMGRSRQLLLLGLAAYQKNGPRSFDLGPVYLRKSEAEICMFGE